MTLIKQPHIGDFFELGFTLEKRQHPWFVFFSKFPASYPNMPDVVERAGSNCVGMQWRGPLANGRAEKFNAIVQHRRLCCHRTTYSYQPARDYGDAENRIDIVSVVYALVTPENSSTIIDSEPVFDRPIYSSKPQYEAPKKVTADDEEVDLQPTY